MRSYIHPFGIAKSRRAVILKARRDRLSALEAWASLSVMAYGLACAIGDDDSITVFRAVLCITEAVK